MRRTEGNVNRFRSARGRRVPEQSLQRRFFFEGVEWTAQRELGVRVVHARPGELIPFPPPSGIRFISATGESRFLAIDFPELPYAERFRVMEEAALIAFLRRARPEAAGE